MREDEGRRYAGSYSDQALFDKLGGFARAAGRELVEKALTLYLVLRDPGTPRWAKSTILGALGYLIVPLDAIPDFIPAAGLTDDLGVLVLALGAVATSITPRIRQAARRATDRVFAPEPAPARRPSGPVVETEATLISREPL